MPKRSYKKREDGRYAVKYHGKFFYGKTQAEAISKRKLYIEQEQNGLRNEQKTVYEYACEWLPVAKASVGDRCYNDYSKQLSTMCDVIGDKLISSVKPSDIKSVWQKYLGKSQSTIHRARMLFNAMFESAVADGYARFNPCRMKQAQPHKGTQGTHRIITAEEIDLIRKTEHRFRLAAMVMLYAGLRRGECLAVDIDKHCDFDSCTLTVCDAVRFESNRAVSAKPKTKAGNRTVPIFDILKKELEGKHGLIMPSAKGAQCTQQAFRRGWQSYNHALSVAAGHQISIRCHDLRHTFCTMLRDAGVQMKLAMKWMGHEDEKMILKIYDHVTSKRVQKAVESVEKILGSSQNGSQDDNGNSENP